MTNEALREVVSLGESIASDYLRVGDTETANLIQHLLAALLHGDEGKTVYYHGDPIPSKKTAKYLYDQATHPRGWQDALPRHVSPEEWAKRCWAFADALKRLKHEDAL